MATPTSNPLYDQTVPDTIARFEATGSPVATDGDGARIATSGRTAFRFSRTQRPTVTGFVR